MSFLQRRSCVSPCSLLTDPFISRALSPCALVVSTNSFGMRAIPLSRATLLILGFLPAKILAADTLSTTGFSLCAADPDIQVQKLDLSFTRSTRELIFNVAGTNEKEQNVTASLEVFAYGKEVYSNHFNPCSSDHFIEQLCPGKPFSRHSVLPS